MEQLDTNRSDLLEIFQVLFDDAPPFDYWDQHDGFETNWNFTVSDGIAILKCALWDVDGNAEDFEWELNLRS